MLIEQLLCARLVIANGDTVVDKIGQVPSPMSSLIVESDIEQELAC